METPPPPSSLPKYLAEGLPKQPDETLLDIQEYIDELLVTRNEAIDETTLPDNAEIVEDHPSRKGSVVKEKVKCGDESCHCADGELHGPYLYRYWKEDGKTRSKYIGKP